MSKMSYREAIGRCLFSKWLDLPRKSVCGNCFQVFGYGLWLIVLFLASLIFRVFAALTFPLSAILLMRVAQRENERMRKAHEYADRLHRKS